jgi:homoserine dehydrogenase
MKDVRIGVLGFGTVGAGVVKCLLTNGDLIAARTGVRPVLARVADLDIITDRGVVVPDGVLTTDAASVIADPSIDIIVELIGGTTIAKTFILEALGAGKSVVTANKALLAHYGDELLAAAEANGTDIYYEASVAGGIPIIKSLREGFAANHIDSIYGILNGTCNYILTRMENEGISFDDVLAEAQALGYAEAEPSFDIDGLDTAHKATILASLAFGQWYGMETLFVDGIRGLDLDDIRNAAEAGYKIKLLAIIKREGDNVQMRVHPTLIPAQSMLAKVDGVFNAVFVKGDMVGETMSYGQGAGRDATASAVVADIIDIGLNLAHDSSRRVPPFRAHTAYDGVVPMGDIVSRYYLRVQIDDKPNTLASITAILGESDISIASLLQRESGSETLPITLITHSARESDMHEALNRIQALDVVHGAAVLMRIEDL